MAQSTSDLSGVPFNADGATTATVVFPDGQRREVRITEAEAVRLRDGGVNTTSPWSRVARSDTARGVAKFLATAVAGGLIGALIAGWIGNRFADRQLEVTIEADLVTEISQAALTVYEQAQSASRVTGEVEKRRQARDAAADSWVETTHGALTPKFETYYGKDSAVTRNWYDYQDTVYTWAVLACCTKDNTSRQADVDQIRAYVKAHTNIALAPSDADWMSLTLGDTPPAAAYQKAGLALLRGRGSLMSDLRRATPQLD